MSPQKLVTQCPHCDTRFRITEAQLDAAGGKARCSRCHRVFNARAYLQEGVGKASRGEAAHRGRRETASAPQPAPPPVETERPGLTATPSTDLDIESSVAADTGIAQVDFELASDFGAPEDPFPSQRPADEPTPEFQPVDTPPPTPETAQTDESTFAFDAASWESPPEADAIDSAVDAAGGAGTGRGVRFRPRRTGGRPRCRRIRLNVRVRTFADGGCRRRGDRIRLPRAGQRRSRHG
ncbi:MAG: hypothetical protein HND59_00175 [Pseudomonadota bacterium]|nr:MAG: hypothetical protein HND59_00175 [Pseudomonadota bacterium]